MSIFSHIKRLCSIFGGSIEASPFPNVDLIFKSVEKYSANSDSLMQTFKQFKISIHSMKNQLKNINNREASLLIHLLEYNLIEFEIWLHDIVDFDETNQKYVNEIIQVDKKYLNMNKAGIEKFDNSLMKELKKVIETHEEYANEQQINLGKIIELIRHEMNHRKFQVDNWAKRFKSEKMSSARMKQIVEEIKSALSPYTEEMKHIGNTLKLCETSKFRMDNSVENAKIF